MSLVFALTQLRLNMLADHIASQNHAMAGATIAASAALASSLGEACLRINAQEAENAHDREAAAAAADRLSAIRIQLLDLADRDGAAIGAFSPLRESGDPLHSQDALCRMPLEMGQVATEAAVILQDCRLLVRRAQDDLEMALTLLDAAARAGILLLDSNLRIWPEPSLLATYEPELASLRDRVAVLQPIARVRA